MIWGCYRIITTYEKDGNFTQQVMLQPTQGQQMSGLIAKDKNARLNLTISLRGSGDALWYVGRCISMDLKEHK